MGPIPQRSPAWPRLTHISPHRFQQTQHLMLKNTRFVTRTTPWNPQKPQTIKMGQKWVTNRSRIGQEGGKLVKKPMFNPFFTCFNCLGVLGVLGESSLTLAEGLHLAQPHYQRGAVAMPAEKPPACPRKSTQDREGLRACVLCIDHRCAT
eukprot:5687579-Amphidinium_carterae.1